MESEEIEQKSNPFKLLYSLGLVFSLLLLAPLAVYLFLVQYLDGPIPLGKQSTLEFHRLKYRYPLQINADSIIFKSPTLRSASYHVQFQISPFSVLTKEDGFLNIFVSEQGLHLLTPPADTTPKVQPPKDPSPIVFTPPELPVLLKIILQNIHVHQDTNLLATVRQLEIQNKNENSLELSIIDAQTDQFSDTISHLGKVSWNEQNISYTSSIFGRNDTLYLNADAPTQAIDSLLLQVKGSIPSLVPYKVLSTPLDTSIHSIHLNGTLSPLQLDGLLFNANLEYQTTSIFDDLLPKLSWKHKINGKWPSIKTQLKAKGKNSSLELQGTGQFDQWSFKGKWSNFPMKIGSRNLPMDAILRSSSINKDGFQAKLRSKAGSEITADGSWSPSFSANLEIEVAAFEPWAIAWCDSSLELQGGKVTAQFKDGILTGNAKSTVPYAYGFASPEVSFDFALHDDDIQFWNGSIQNPTDVFDFTGKVDWNPPDYSFQFQIWNDTQGSASIYGDHTAKMTFSTSEFQLNSLPIIERDWLQYTDGKVTTTWTGNVDHDTSRAHLQYVSSFKNVPYQALATLRQNGSKIQLDTLHLHHSQSNLYLNGGIHYNKHWIVDSLMLSTPSFHLPVWINEFSDSLLKTARFVGDLKYTNEKGFSGYLSGDSISFHNSSIPYFPSLSIQGLAEKITVDARMKYGPEGIWDSDVALEGVGLLSDTAHINAALVNDNGGLFWLQSKSYQWENIVGESHLSGNWLLGGEHLRIADLSSRGIIRLNTSKGLNGLSIDLPLNKGTLFLDKDTEYPFQFNANLNQSFVETKATLHAKETLDSILFDGAYSFNQKKLMRFDLSSPHFIFPIDTKQYIEWNDLNASLQENTSFSLNLELPTLKYFWQEKGLGVLRAQVDDLSLAYEPSSNETQSKISGSGDVKKLIYSNQTLPELGIAELQSFFNSLSSSKTSKSSKVEKDPIFLDIALEDPGSDSLFVSTNLTTLPVTLDLQVKGTTQNPLLLGNANTTSEAPIALGFSEFDITQVDVTWNRDAPMDGKLTLRSFRDIKYCDSQTNTVATCPIYLNLDGTLDKIALNPEATCNGTELSQAQTLIVALVGCVSTDDSFLSDTQMQNFGVTFVSKELAKFVNKSVGGKRIVRNINYNTQNNADGNDTTTITLYTKIPFVDSPNWSIKTEFQEYSTLLSTDEKNQYLSSGLNGTWKTSNGQFEADLAGVSRPSSFDETKNEFSFLAGLSYLFSFWGDWFQTDPEDKSGDNP